MPIRYRLEENSLKVNSYYARVIRESTVSHDELIAALVTRTGLSAQDLQMVLDALNAELAQNLIAGRAITIKGLATFVVSLSGKFTSPDVILTKDNAQLSISIQESASLCGIVASQASYSRESMAVKVPIIGSFYDVASKSYNSYTAGNIIRLTGDNLKFNPEQQDEGVFVHASVPSLRLSSYSVINNKQIDGLMPAEVSGDLTVIVRARYTADGSLRESTYQHLVSPAS